MIGQGILNVAGINVPFIDEVSVSINKSIADVREPAARDSEYTKTIRIPGTAEVNIIFELIFELNVELATFNPNLATPAAYYSNNVEQIRGNLQLLDIDEEYDSGVRQVYYNCQITGNTADLFQGIQSKFLTDIDFSDLDHTFDYSPGVFNPTPGIGFGYGYIDYGLNNGNVNNWYFKDLKPYIFAKEYIDRIFSDAGFTYTSSFLNSSYFAGFCIPDVNEGRAQMSQTQIDNSQFYVGRTTAVSAGGSYFGDGGLLVNGVTYLGAIYTANNIVPYVFNDDSTAPFSDPGGIYNTGTGVVTTSIASIATYTARFPVSLTFSAPAGATSYDSFYFFGNIRINVSNGGGTNVSLEVPVEFINLSGNVISGGVIITGNFTATLPAQFFLPSSTITVDFSAGLGVMKWYNGVTYITGVGSTLSYSIDAGRFYNNLQDYGLQIGNTLEMNTTIPKDVRQIDFLTSIMNAFNLYMERDRSNKNNYIIEPRDAFIDTTTSVNWTKKQDTKPGIKIIPMGELDARSYLLKYKEDDDEYNTLYQDNYAETYGQRRYDVESDFVKEEKVIELIFSPTPGVSLGSSDIVAPRFYTSDGTNIKPKEVNIRLLYFDGLKPCNTHTLYATIFDTPISLSTYPYVGHLDDPNNPTIDLCFSAPRRLFYNLPGQVYTTNNLSNRYWTKYINEITDPDSKIVQTYIDLNDYDINVFSFRKQIELNGTYFLVNKIIDYNPHRRRTTLVELLKLKAGITSPAAVQYNPYGPPANSGNRQSFFLNPEFNYLGNYHHPESLVIGSNVIHNGVGGIVVGSRSTVSTSDFSAIGVTNQSFGSEYFGKVMLRNNGLLVGDDGVQEDKKAREVATANVTVTKPVTFINATGGNINVKLPLLDAKGEYTLVRTDNSGNTVRVTGYNETENLISGGTTGTFYNLPAGTTKRFNSNSANWYYYG